MADSVITDEMRQAIGVESPPSTLEVTTTGIRMFARAVGHTDPIFYDEAAARERGYRGLVAPPGYLGTPVSRPPAAGAREDGDMPGGDRQFTTPFKRILNGGTTYEYLEPIVAGDVITSRSCITEFKERDGSVGTMLITYRKTTYTRQDGTVVARMYGNIINY